MKLTISLFLLLLLNAPLVSAMSYTGEELHAQFCVSCHAQGFADNGSAIYTRGDRRIRDLAGLHRQVNFCQNNLGLGWFDEEAESVADYLNHQYYHFH